MKHVQQERPGSRRFRAANDAREAREKAKEMGEAGWGFGFRVRVWGVEGFRVNKS